VKALIRASVFADSVKLPEGLRFKEWSPNVLLVASPPASQNPQTYFDSTMMGIERTSDGRYASFKISNLKQKFGEEIYISVVEVAIAVDKAIAQLEETHGQG
jgi:hypothetical protein